MAKPHATIAKAYWALLPAAAAENVVTTGARVVELPSTPETVGALVGYGIEEVISSVIVVIVVGYGADEATTTGASVGLTVETGATVEVTVETGASVELTAETTGVSTAVETSAVVDSLNGQ